VTSEEDPEVPKLILELRKMKELRGLASGDFEAE